MGNNFARKGRLRKWFVRRVINIAWKAESLWNHRFPRRDPFGTRKAQIDKAKGRFHHEGSKDTKKSIIHQALFKAKGRFHHEGPKDSKKTIIHQALIKPEAENISHGDHGADTEEHGELKLKNETNFRLTLREA